MLFKVNKPVETAGIKKTEEQVLGRLMWFIFLMQVSASPSTISIL